MQFQSPFDASRVEPSSFPPPPVMADYHVRIVDSEAKENSKAGTGGHLQLDLEILDPGPYAGVKIPYRLNLWNTGNQQTVEIAYRQLSAICHVTKVFNVTDTRQLHNIPFIATIGPQKDNPQYANVFNIKDINGQAPGKGGAATPGAPAPVAAAAPPAAAPTWGAPSAAPPWGGAPAPAPTVPTWPGAPAPVAAAPPANNWGPPAPPAAAAPPAQSWGPPAAAAPPAAAPGGWQPTGAPAPAPAWAVK